MGCASGAIASGCDGAAGTSLSAAQTVGAATVGATHSAAAVGVSTTGVAISSAAASATSTGASTTVSTGSGGGAWTIERWLAANESNAGSGCGSTVPPIASG